MLNLFFCVLWNIVRYYYKGFKFRFNKQSLTNLKRWRFNAVGIFLLNLTCLWSLSFSRIPLSQPHYYGTVCPWPLEVLWRTSIFLTYWRRSITDRIGEWKFCFISFCLFENNDLVIIIYITQYCWFAVF